MSILTHDSRHGAAPAHSGLLDVLARALGAVWTNYKAHREMAAQRLLVASLTDRQLADLGLRPDQVTRRDYAGPHAL
jgi:uncharacterized protein YjiS (DUF1127 family)